MWRVLDAARAERRRSLYASHTAVYEAHLRREQHPDLLARPRAESHRLLGGEAGRTFLVSWLFDEARRLHLLSATAFCAVSYLDRLLVRPRTPLTRAQHLARACLFLAAKMTEEGGDGMSVLDDPTAHHPDPAVEIAALKLLSWNLVAPTAFTFLQTYALRFWLPPDGSDRSEQYLRRIVSCARSLEFFPSSLALVSILLLERDDALPPPCKSLVLNTIREDHVRTKQVTDAFRFFRSICPLQQGQGMLGEEQNVASVSSDSSPSSTSWTTAYPASSTESGTPEW